MLIPLSQASMTMLEQVRLIFKKVITYQETAVRPSFQTAAILPFSRLYSQDSLCNYALAAANNAETAQDAVRVRRPPSLLHSTPALTPELSQGIFPSPRLPTPPPTVLEGIETRLEDASVEFRALATALIKTLGTSGDLDFRFLAARLNFNYHFDCAPFFFP